MKKFLALLMALAMVLALAACGGQSAAPAAEAPAAGNDAPAAEAPAAEAPADGVIQLDQSYDWKFACSATDNTCWADMGRQFGQYLSDRTGGKVTVTVYAQDQLTSGNQQEGIQAVIDGSTDMCAHSNLIMSGFDQRLNVVSLPFIFESTDDVDALLGAGGAGYEALAPIVEGLGLHLLGVAENGFRHVTNSKKEITSPADMKDMKIRIPNTAVLTYAYGDWGANWQIAHWGEVYTGLQQGTYDGQENPLPTADGGSISDVNKYCTYWTGVYDCIFFCMNQELYDSLPAELQALVDEAGAWAAAQQRELERKGDQEVIEKWTNEGVTFTYLTDDQVKEFQAASANVADEWAATCVKDYGFTQEEMDSLIGVFTGK